MLIGEPEVDTSQPLITKYRPDNFDLVAGNIVAVNTLHDVLISPSHVYSFLLTGPAGVGKTTLARIIAKKYDLAIVEIDVAAHNGVDDADALVKQAQFKPVMVEKGLLYILDECHTYSKQAWQALLKIMEEPPKWTHFALCTTDITKIPDTIRTRCFHVPLKPLSSREIEELLLPICEVEGWEVTNDVLAAIVQAATGQPRKALSILQVAHNLTTTEQVAQVVAEVDSDKSPVIELCKYLINNGKDWKRVSGWLTEIDNEEEAFASASRYIYGMMVKTDETQAKKAWAILDALTYPRTVWDKKVHLGVVIGGLLWS